MFIPFSHEHILTVLIGAAMVAGLLVAGRRGGTSRTLATATLAFLNLSAYPSNLAGWLMLDGPIPLGNLLPFHLCDVAAFTAGFALLTKRPILCALTYFWGLAATVQALLTPAISVGFPSWAFISFFIQHFAIVAAALYLPIVEGWRPRQSPLKSTIEVYKWSVVYLVFTLVVNQSMRTNFGFSMRPPENPSLIDHLGPWPWYLISMMAIGVIVFYLLAIPLSSRSRD